MIRLHVSQRNHINYQTAACMSQICNKTVTIQEDSSKGSSESNPDDDTEIEMDTEFQMDYLDEPVYKLVIVGIDYLSWDPVTEKNKSI